MKNFVFGLLATAAAALPVTAQAQNLVQNGGFETGDFTNWTVGNASDFTGVDGTFFTVAPHGGNFQAFFGTVGSNTTLTQQLSTTLGGTYSVSFWLANLSGNGPNFFSAAFGLQPLGTPIVATVLTPGTDFPYTKYTYTGIATGDTTDLSFTFRHDPSYFLLDDVSVTASTIGGAVPEPATWAMLLLGFGTVGATLRRRQKVKVSYAA